LGVTSHRHIATSKAVTTADQLAFEAAATAGPRYVGARSVEWQAYRTRKANALPLEITHAYSEPGDYTIVIKVIDILCNDTTKTVKVSVR
jgi:hypothetical protein